MQILGADGQPFVKATTQPAGSPQTTQSSFMNALQRIKSNPFAKTASAYRTHAWVYACAHARALNLSQAPFTVMRDTTESEKVRKFVHKHVESRSRSIGYRDKALEPVYDDPAMLWLTQPNTHLAGGPDLWYLTELWMAFRGEAFWIYLNEEGRPCPAADAKSVIIPSPDNMTEIIKNNELVGWVFYVSRGLGLNNIGRPQPLFLDEVQQFKRADPEYPIRGLSPITAAAQQIYNDVLANAHNTGTLENGGEPSGVLMHDGKSQAFKSDDQRKDFLLAWEQRHAGASNSRRTAVLTGGWTYSQIGLSPKDYEFIRMFEWDRDVVLAVMGVPKSVLAVTDDLPYAAQIAQDRNFWDKTLLPQVRYYERALDYTLFANRLGNVGGLFDLSRVEALRAAMNEKIDMATKLAAAGLRMPPRQALALVGIDAESYVTDDIALVPWGLVPAETAGQEGGGDAAIPVGDPAAGDPTPVGDGKIRAGKKRPKWRDIIEEIQLPAERDLARLWKTWVRLEQTLQLEAFDKITKATIDIDGVIRPLAAAQANLTETITPGYEDNLSSIFKFTATEIGNVTTITVSDRRITAALNRRIKTLVGSAPKTIQQNVRKSLLTGMDAGETVQQLRKRVAKVYTIASSSPKSLMVARTESAGLMNSVRDTMFKAEGVDGLEWTTASDEVVRPSHASFGSAGVKPIGYNYLEIIGEDSAGTLEFPGDTRAPAGEVINCRCVHILP